MKYYQVYWECWDDNTNSDSMTFRDKTLEEMEETVTLLELANPDKFYILIEIEVELGNDSDSSYGESR